MDNNKTNWFKVYIIDVLPCITLSLYLLAMIYNIAFYSVFNINIIPYISVSGLLLSIIEPLVLCLGISLLIAYFFLIYFDFFLPKFCGAISEFVTKPWRLLRLVVKIKNQKSINIIINHLKNSFKWRKDESKLSFHIMNLIFLWFVMAITFDVFDMHQFEQDSNYGLSKAAYGLMLPFVEALILSWFLPMLFPKKVTHIIDFFKKYKTIDKVAAVVIFYIYSLNVFYKSGLDCGAYYKNSNNISFEIKSTDGTIYNDSLYIYIGKVNNKLFLHDRKSETNCILNDNGSVYIKMADYSDNQSILLKLMSTLK